MAHHQLAPDLTICRLLNGMWQVSGAHGYIDPEAAIDSMLAYHRAGLTTWDLADHYGPAEDFIGAFRSRLAETEGEAALADSQALTKWVPRPQRITRALVEQAVQVSLRRMDVDTLDLLQFHWWDYSDTGYLDTLIYLAQQRDAGHIRYLGLTNFDTAHVERIIRSGVPIVSNQVQYSLVDRRPEVKMASLCQAHGVGLLAYGTLCGGLLTDRYLGQREPHYLDLNTASLRKYKQMVDAWGGWDLLQSLLRALRRVADRHQASIANVAVRYILDKPAVAGVIVGARLGVNDHYAATRRVFDLALTDEDRAEIEAITGRDLFSRIGDCGDEYRRR